jgi:PAS domain S-box-containing protein
MKVVAQAGDDHGYLSKVRVSVDPSDPLSHGPTGRCARTGQAVVVNDFASASMTTPWHEEGTQAGFGASAAFPFFEQGSVAAVLSLYATRDFFTDDLVATLSELTPIVSKALEGLLEARAYEKSEDALSMRDRAILALEQGVVIADVRNGGESLIYASPGFTFLTGYPVSEAIGRNCAWLQGPETDPAAVSHLRELVRRRVAGSAELINYRKDGSTFWNHVAISPVRDAAGVVTHLVGVQTDVSERRAIEGRLRQAAKMDAVGQLAAGVAHDFNNLLAVILSYTNLALEDLPANSQLHGDLNEIRRAGERAADLTRQLLAFTRQQVFVPRVIELNELLQGMQKMLGRLLGEDIELSLLVSEGGRVFADQTQLEQIVMNLSVNARDAMPHGGTLTIESAPCDVSEASGANGRAVPPGRYVVLSVADTGEGMSAAVRERIFEPFFTTKEKGKGTGLGLATVFGIVSQSKGYLEVTSEPTRGTRFKVYLPRVDREFEAPARSPSTERTPGGHETILLVEDDVQVRAVTRAVLTRSGYQVLDATNGGEAFLIVEQHAGPIDLLLSDIVMPRMSGYELAKRLVKQRPTLKVLLMSGYVEDPAVRQEIEGTLLHKPFTPEVLLQTVRERLDAPTHDSLGG